MSFRIAIAGNPNCGKTTLFNKLTGLRHKVANYPGVTVEKKEGTLTIPGLGSITVIDLPGTYSLSGSSPDEAIACQCLMGQIQDEPPPDLIISVVDATNLERNLYLTSQLLDLGIPIVMALNMMDLAEAQGTSVKKEILAKDFDVPVIAISAAKELGLTQLRDCIESLLVEDQPRIPTHRWCDSQSILAEASKLADLFPGEIPQTMRIPYGLLLISGSNSTRSQSALLAIEQARDRLKSAGIDFASFDATQRYRWINSVIRRCVVLPCSNRSTWSKKIDQFLIHKVWGTLFLALVMWTIFQSIFMWAAVPMGWIDQLFVALGNLAAAQLPDSLLRSLVIDGIIPGVGSVVIFVPQIAVLFFFLGVLEDTGYLSRAAFLMDSIMRRVGLQGRSFIPLLGSFACAIPGIMSTRTIPSFADRMVTILVAPWMSCSARLPVYAVLIAAFIPSIYYFGIFSLQGLVLFAMYLLGVLGAALVAWLLKLTLFKGEPALFVMEMPPFRLPNFRNVAHEVFDRILIFLKSAGTMILACSVILWFLASFPKGDVKDSYAGQIGSAIEPIIEPLGFNWEIGVAILGSLAAREVFVSSLATVYNIADRDESTESLITALGARRNTGHFSTATALSLMVFYVFACMCMSTIAVCKRETGSWRWAIFMFAYMTGTAYLASFITYQIAVRCIT